MSARKPDLSEFFRLSRPKKRPCAVGHARATLSDPEVEQLDAAAGVDPGVITNAAIQRWLEQRKHEMSIPVIVSHRKRTCSCYDE